MNVLMLNAELSEREWDILMLLIKGLSNKAIAARLEICEKTVEFHLHNIYQKLNVKSRAEAIVWAFQNMKT